MNAAALWVAAWRSLVAQFGLWRRRAREREALARMSLDELADIRLNRYEARLEANKPFWRA